MLELVGVVVLVVGLLWAVAVFHLRGADMSAFDTPVGERIGPADAPSAQLQPVLASLTTLIGPIKAVPMRQRNAALREMLDRMFEDRELDARSVPVDAGGVRAQWVLAPGADPDRRLLYIHGGAFTLGSPKSHRTVTSQLSAVSGAAVLAIDYRLMPEHPRRAGIDDCRNAYRWLLDHGPERAAPAGAVFVAGDSAGGNLTLSLIHWVRDAGLRAPDAAVALSPLTDATFSSPSMRDNVATDPMLGPMFGPMARIPQWVLLWVGWLQTRIRPCDPLVSPLRADLSRLPPVLLQASEVEMLFDDSRRYVNRARAAGSPVQLQVWSHMVHVWQLFNPELPEARQALAEVGKFLQAVAPRRSTIDSAVAADTDAAAQPRPRPDQ